MNEGRPADRSASTINPQLANPPREERPQPPHSGSSHTEAAGPCYEPSHSASQNKLLVQTLRHSGSLNHAG